MTDILLIRDAPSFAETAFRAYDLSFLAVHPAQIASPHLPSAALTVIPSGFGNPAYSKVSLFFKPAAPEKRTSLPRLLHAFAHAGGTVLIFSPVMDGFDLSALGFSDAGLTGFYRQKNMSLPADPALLKDTGTMFCDGFLEIIPASDSPAAPASDSPAAVNPEETVFFEKKVGKGHLIMTTIHEMPSKAFFLSLLSVSEKSRFCEK